MKQYISSRNFSNETVQYILETLDTWTDMIKNNENFTFVKFGDGEFYCMMGENGENCDHHPYSEELGQKLYDAWYFYNTLDNVWVAEWAGHKPGMVYNTPSEKFQEELINKTDIKVKFAHYEIMLQNTLSQNKYNMFKAIKESDRKKIFIGPSRLYNGVKSFLNMDDFVEVPLINAFGAFDSILENAKSKIEDDCIVVTCAGMPAKSIVHKLLEHNKNITCLDMGSGLDSIFIGHTREGQHNILLVKNYYKELL